MDALASNLQSWTQSQSSGLTTIQDILLSFQAAQSASDARVDALEAAAKERDARLNLLQRASEDHALQLTSVAADIRREASDEHAALASRIDEVAAAAAAAAAAAMGASSTADAAAAAAADAAAAAAAAAATAAAAAAAAAARPGVAPPVDTDTGPRVAEPLLLELQRRMAALEEGLAAAHDTASAASVSAASACTEATAAKGTADGASGVAAEAMEAIAALRAAAQAAGGDGGGDGGGEQWEGDKAQIEERIAELRRRMDLTEAARARQAEREAAVLARVGKVEADLAAVIGGAGGSGGGNDVHVEVGLGKEAAAAWREEWQEQLRNLVARLEAELRNKAATTALDQVRDDAAEGTAQATGRLQSQLDGHAERLDTIEAGQRNLQDMSLAQQTALSLFERETTDLLSEAKLRADDLRLEVARAVARTKQLGVVVGDKCDRRELRALMNQGAKKTSESNFFAGSTRCLSCTKVKKGDAGTR